MAIYLPDPIENSDATALLHAARQGDHNRIRRLVREGHDVNGAANVRQGPDEVAQPMTPLMAAAASSHGATVETMQLLVRLGADPHRETGYRTLADCAVDGDAHRLRNALTLGCDSNSMRAAGGTLLSTASRRSLDMVKVLLDAGANPNVGIEGAYFADIISLHQAVKANQVEIAALLIEAGADARAVDAMGETALAYATSAEMVRLLMDAGVDIEARDKVGWTPLVHAVFDNNVDRARALIDAGADVNATHDRGFTVFMSAVGVENRSLGMLDLLVEGGADPLAVSDLGWNAFHAAIDVLGPANTVESVRAIFERLLEFGVDINQKNRAGETPLARARGMFGTPTEVDELIRLGARE